MHNKNMETTKTSHARIFEGDPMSRKILRFIFGSKSRDPTKREIKCYNGKKKGHMKKDCHN